MNTPLCDFVRDYAARGAVRAHMPGHKGKGPLGVEARDITEIEGADVLYRAEGVLRESQQNAAALFGTAKTLYSAEGSSLSVRAMLYLAQLHAAAQGKPPLILAGRNAHKTFLTAAALLDLRVEWLLPEGGSVLGCEIPPQTLARRLAAMPSPPAAVYITSPDYLGNVADLSGLCAVCRRFGCLLLVDNAHGAYLRFLPEDRHPITLGADLCCDSAHKTLPVLTGGGYLHVSRSAPRLLADAAESAMQLFASTSPSYLILQSLDAANALLAGAYPARLAAFAAQMAQRKDQLTQHGYRLLGNEIFKLVLDAKAYGYTGTALGALLRDGGVECELADPDVTVLMLTPENGDEDLQRLTRALLAIPKRPPLSELPPQPPVPVQVMTPRQALLSPSKALPVAQCEGRILAQPCVSCPPAVPVAVCGERLTKAHLALFRYYGIPACRVVKQRGVEPKSVFPGGGPSMLRKAP